MEMTNKLGEKESIPAFYAGRSIFVTGATGFMGKALIEKLLRSCPGIREIFLLTRPKKGVSIDERIKTMISNPLFDRLRKENPSAFGKLIAVQGDIMHEGLGLGPVERQVLIERVSIIFHAAANVRFNEDLKQDILSNTRSTRDICILAGRMKNLVALVYVSSTFSQSDKTVVEEIVYPPVADWKKVIKTVELQDSNTLRTFTTKFYTPMANSYTFSKRLAESVVNDFSKDLPCLIYRVSIVLPTTEDPIPGWLDNFNGPVGLMVGATKGVLRVVGGDPHIYQDYIPLDVATKAMLTATWMRGKETITKNPGVHVVNCASNKIKRITARNLISMGLSINRNTPVGGTIWRPNAKIVKNRTFHYLQTLIFHLLPALIIDTGLKLAGRPPMLVQLQRKIYATSTQLNYFVNNEFTFENGKLQKMLVENVPVNDRPDFAFDYTNFNMRHFLERCAIGIKLYLLSEDPGNIEAARRHYNRMWWLDAVLKILLTVFAAWVLRRLGVYSYLCETFQPVLNVSTFDE